LEIPGNPPAVIPAGMQESRHMDVKLATCPKPRCNLKLAIRGRWIPAIHAGMTIGG